MSSNRLVPHALAGATLALLAACQSTGAAAHPAQQAPANTAPAGDSSSRSLEKMLTGKFPGVIVTPDAGGGIRILMRGVGSSDNTSSEPLYILDDVPLPEGNGGLVQINPYDIERIQVLKNPADIAIYGMRGSNGVIKITTKRHR